MKERLNFAPAPFPRRSPAKILLWLANLVCFLAVISLVVYWNSLRGDNASIHQQIDGLEQEQRTIADRHKLLTERLEEIDVPTYRKKVLQFHQIQSAYRTHWGRLLDDLGEHLPEDVRITSLIPVSTSTRPTRTTARDNTVIQLRGEARTKEAQLDFIRTLQDQPAFDNVRFENEDYDHGGVAVMFEILFTHRPEGGSTP